MLLYYFCLRSIAVKLDITDFPVTLSDRKIANKCVMMSPGSCESIGKTDSPARRRMPGSGRRRLSPRRASFVAGYTFQKQSSQFGHPGKLPGSVVRVESGKASCSQTCLRFLLGVWCDKKHLICAEMSHFSAAVRVLTVLEPPPSGPVHVTFALLY